MQPGGNQGSSPALVSMQTTHLPQISLRQRITVITMAILLAALSLWSLVNILDPMHLAIACLGSLLPLALVIDQVRRGRRFRLARQAFRSWLQQGRDRLALELQPHHSLPELSRALLGSLAELTDSGQGLFYYAYDRDLLLLESCLGSEIEGLPSRPRPDGPVLRCARDLQPVTLSGTEASATTLGQLNRAARGGSQLYYPLQTRGQVLGVLALALPGADSSPVLEFLDHLAPLMTGALERVSSQEKTQELLRVTQAQAKALERHRQDLQEQTEALARATHYKSRFLANMSHELRSPLNSVLLLAQMIEEKPEPADQVVDNARIIQRCGRELLELIEDILDLAKVEAGKLDYLLEPVDLPGLEFTIQSSQGPLARRKNLEFGISTQAGLPTRVITDGKRLLQIVRNLVANAIKFTERGGIVVTMDWEPAPGSGEAGELVIAVADTGPGIPLEDQERVFEEFGQADLAREKGFEGTGLGLSISRRLAEDLGGALELLSRPGQGSTFTLRLPCSLDLERESSPGAAAAPHEAALPGSDLMDALKPEPPTARIAPPDQSPLPAPGEQVLSGRKILLVGSNMRSLFSLLSTLEAAGAVVQATGSPQQGRLLLDQHPELDMVLVEGPLHDLEGSDMDSLLAQAHSRGIPAALWRATARQGKNAGETADSRFVNIFDRIEDLADLTADADLDPEPGSAAGAPELLPA